MSSKPQSALRGAWKDRKPDDQGTETNIDYVDPQSKSSSRSNLVHYAGLFVIGYSRLNWRQVDIPSVYNRSTIWDAMEMRKST